MLKPITRVTGFNGPNDCPKMRRVDSMARDTNEVFAFDDGFYRSVHDDMRMMMPGHVRPRESDAIFIADDGSQWEREVHVEYKGTDYLVLCGRKDPSSPSDPLIELHVSTGGDDADHRIEFISEIVYESVMDVARDRRAAARGASEAAERAR